jgi:hypothetical protein
MVRKTMITAASVLLIATPAFAQQLSGDAGNDAAALRQEHHALNHIGRDHMRQGRSAYMPKHRQAMKHSTPANEGTYGGTQVPGHGGSDTGK